VLLCSGVKVTIMAAHCFSTSASFEMGDLVCVDSAGQAVAYDPLDPKPVVGTAFVPTEGYNPNGRQWFAVNGPVYYENDFYEWTEDLTSDFVTENPSYSPFNPLNTSGYVTAITNGIAAVKSSASGIPSSWILLQQKTNYNLYLIR
jgi:hypothetical protein